MRTQTRQTEENQETVALGDFKADISGTLRRVRESGHALVVTENGEATLVLLTPDEFHALRYRQKFVAAVLEGLADVRAGRVIDDDAFGQELDAKFGPMVP